MSGPIRSLSTPRSWAPEGNQWTTGWIFDPDYSHSMAAPITDIHLYSHRTQLCQIMKPTQIFTNGAPEYGICVVAYTRDSRGNHPGPGGKPAQYRSKTPPKGHTWFTHTTKNKVERLPSLRARATVPLSHTHAHTCMAPKRSCAVHGPARALGCPSALRHTATAPNDSLAAATTFATGSPSSSLPEAYRSLPFFWFPCLSSCCRLAGFKEGKLPSCSRARPRSQAVEAASCSR